MPRFTSIILAALSVVSVNGAVQVLNDGNFERITQATTGSTTGSWLVKFCVNPAHLAYMYRFSLPLSVSHTHTHTQRESKPTLNP